jgi:epoxyqueuosine reductase
MSHRLVEKIKKWGLELGFQQVGIADTQLNDAEDHLHHWLDKGFHGELDYMAKHGLKRSRPALLHPNTQSIISVRMDYLPEDSTAGTQFTYVGLYFALCARSRLSQTHASAFTKTRR